MPSHVVAQPVATSNRFFAITAERLESIQRHRLTRADILVWGHVELSARPRFPIAFTLEGISERLHIGVASVRRAVRRLLEVRLLVGIFEGNRYRLAPAAGAFDQAGENRSESAGFPARAPHQRAGSASAKKVENRSESACMTGTILPDMGGLEPGNQETVRDSGDPHTSSSENKIKLSSPLVTTLTRDWGMFGPVAERMVTTYGEERVREVLAWADYLKGAGKLKSRGWVYQALVRGWAAPDGINTTRYKAQEGRSVERQVSQGPAPSKEEQERIVRWHLGKKHDATLRAEGQRLAVLWGVSVEGAGG